MIPHSDLLALQNYQPHDALETAHLARLVEHLGSPESSLLRANQQGHLTASAWIINQAGTHALLLNHSKLKRLLQPGGHVDPEDESLLLAAIRETQEETGLNHLISLLDGPFDVDAHHIPARSDEPAHVHYDTRFIFQLPPGVSQTDVAITLESKGYAWVELSSIAETDDESLARMARKSMAFGASYQPSSSKGPSL